jgi:Arylsulfotransferase (ASST)
MAERAGPLGGMARIPRRFRVVAAAFAVSLVALGLAACQPVKPPPPPPLVSTNPALFPGFQTSVADYVDRCDPNTPTDVNVNAPDGTTVSVNGSPPASGQFSVQVAQSVAARFTIVVTTNGNTTTHYVRCLPGDFPNWSVEKSGSTEAQFYATAMAQGGFGTPGYSVVFDSNGVPIWWLAPHPTFLLQPLPNKDFAVMNIGGGMQEYDLSGKLVRSLNAVGGPTDFHEVIQLPNGNYVMATAQNEPCNLSSWGLGTAETCIDHVFQEINPAAPTVPVWTWDTAAHIPVTETADAWINEQTSQSRTAYDPYHYNSIEYTGDGFILSFRHLDAVYKVDHTIAGNIQWKLGGKPHNGTSLTIVNDALGGARQPARRPSASRR